MPELPEVNAVAMAMNELLAGDAIAGWHRLSPKLRRAMPTKAEFARLLGKPLVAVKRVAKSIYLDFGVALFLHAHLGMTGSFTLADQPPVDLKHEHLRLSLLSGRVLSFCDPRRFGIIELVTGMPVRVVEPFAGELTAEYLTECCQSGRSIKSLIMDQSIIAGVGNIYASESLLLAGVRPDRPADSLAQAEVAAVVAGLVTVIAAAIASAERQQRLHGLHLNSQTAHFPIVTHVYSRAGELCGLCARGEVASLRIAGRSSFFCPICQK